MADAKRPLESKDPEPVAKALAGTLEPQVLNHRPRSKRQKVQGPPPPVPNRPRQCHFLQPNKNKYCSLTTKLGNKFCGEHSMYESATSTTSSDGTEGTNGGPDGQAIRKRIPCPFDPSHTAWADDLKAHLYKCNARPRDAAAHFSKDINLTLPNPKRSIETNDVSAAETGSAESATTSSTVKPDILATLSQEQLMSLIKKIQDSHAKHVPEIRTLILDHPALDERKKILKNIKHAHQQASLLGHMKRLDMLNDSNTCYVEFGAGRGELSNYLKIAVDDHGTATFLLVDRTPSRNKFDSAILGLEEIKSLVKRYTMDIKDLVLAKVPELRKDVTATQRTLPVKDAGSADKTENGDSQDGSEYVEKKPVVAISKHLCGGATDLTLKCLTSYQQSERKHSSLPSPVKGILIALCCHQLCHHYMYPNQQFLKEIDISAEEFVYLTRMSSWAVCVNQTKTEKAGALSEASVDSETSSNNSPAACDDDHRIEADSELENLSNNIPAMDSQARERLGQQCKRLLDIGRVRYLKENGFDAELVYYVDPETSLENLALMAVPVPSAE
ncbi:tRNA:m(4)X modification enzyme TRM13 [Entomortierella chlamydospora]|uniref:tRNA:m(4)X modification enzyme TRM13 n=1 Tax=Entomortierella chlamydospora TaxID=101097 RepID=A0A9P6MWB3_9FUNG|nr:tRNA:m(4)X modification enzyme TRM13 [Entomortierella chlamydospora]KAG0015287.1 tRNA:m(4)X modification enzyme TRM13 [Entomortierella chlamydospora]